VSQNHHGLMGMAISQSAACARCDKQDCSAIVIIPAVLGNLKSVEHAKECLELMCPACHRFFSVPFRNVEYRDVTDEELTRGFIDGRFIDPRWVQ
jgi:predicted phosphoribosyltransferase